MILYFIMEKPYNEAQLRNLYEMFCDSVGDCMRKLRSRNVSNSNRELLERRVKVTFLMTDYSLSSLDGMNDSLLSEFRRGVNQKRLEWGHYRSSTFRVPSTEIDRAYNECWKEETQLV